LIKIKFGAAFANTNKANDRLTTEVLTPWSAACCGRIEGHAYCNNSGSLAMFAAIRRRLVLLPVVCSG